MPIGFPGCASLSPCVGGVVSRPRPVFVHATRHSLNYAQSAISVWNPMYSTAYPPPPPPSLGHVCQPLANLQTPREFGIFIILPLIQIQCSVRWTALLLARQATIEQRNVNGRSLVLEIAVETCMHFSDSSCARKSKKSEEMEGRRSSRMCCNGKLPGYVLYHLLGGMNGTPMYISV